MALKTLHTALPVLLLGEIALVIATARQLPANPMYIELWFFPCLALLARLVWMTWAYCGFRDYQFVTPALVEEFVARWSLALLSPLILDLVPWILCFPICTAMPWVWVCGRVALSLLTAFCWLGGIQELQRPQHEADLDEC